jgi:tRNA threonylcarbamoyladenosine biosynthesis protein TsaB
MRHGHAEALMPMIDRVTSAAGLTSGGIDVIGVTVGPGGFTGIRAGLAAAHGLALATGARLVGITSFVAVAALTEGIELRLLVALDSRRTDFYVQLFDEFGAPRGEPGAVAPAQLAAWVGEGDLLVVAGDAAAAAADRLSARPRIRLLPGSAPDACGVLAALWRWPERADPTVQPLYLRPPDVSFPKMQRRIGGVS